MSKVEIYTWMTCPFCNKAKSLLDSKGIKFIEYKIDGDQNAREKMRLRANGANSLPQIFIDNKHIGGCDNLHSLDKSGELDELIKN